MSHAPKQEEGESKHCYSPIYTFGVPQVVVKVCVLFPKLKVGAFFPNEFE